MGDFRITVEAVGGHGCGRAPGDFTTDGPVPEGVVPTNGHVVRCRRLDCPDCLTIEFVRTLKAHGCSVSMAKLEHWPVPGAGCTRTEKPGPIDDLLAGTRDRQF